MKKLAVLVCLFLAVLTVATLERSAYAQQATSSVIQTQQTAWRADALTCQGASGTAQQTVTIQVPPGQCAYVMMISSTAQATSAPAASAATTTTTNLGAAGSTSPSLVCGLTATAGVSCDKTFAPMSPIKSVTPGTNVTVVSNGAIANVTFTLGVCYYLGSC